MGEQIVLRFSISIRQTFSTWIAFTEINKYGKVAVVQLWTAFVLFTMLLEEGSSERDFWHTYLATYFGIGKFKNISAMMVIFFKKNFITESKFRKCKIKLENIFRFWDKCVWKCCNKLPLLRRNYLSSAVNGLTSSPKIFHIAQRDFLILNCLHSY